MWATKFKTYSKEDHLQAENTMTPDWWYGIGRFQVRVKRELPMTYLASVSRVRYVCDGACYLNWNFWPPSINWLRDGAMGQASQFPCP